MAEAQRRIDDWLNNAHPRIRNRKVADQQAFEDVVTAVVCELAHLVVYGSTKGVGLSRSNNWPAKRYQTRLHTKYLAKIIDALHHTGLCQETRGHQGFGEFKGRLTSLLPGPQLRKLLAGSSIDHDDFELRHEGETIHLIAAKRGNSSGQLIDYAETDTTMALRKEMTAINKNLLEADIEFDEFILAQDEQLPDLDRRTLVRRFTQGNFDCGGRLWNGFWQDMKKKHRVGLSINGEDVVELDYGQAGARILYGLARAPVPETDLYTIPGYENFRSGIKKAMSAMTFSSDPLKRFPPDMKQLFGRKHSWADVVAAVENRHQPIADQFFRGVGHRTQRIESNILVASLLCLISEGITTLPIHDALIVPIATAEKAGKIMEEIFEKHAGVQGVVTITRYGRPENTDEGED